jgi:hypothetical protein
LPSYAEDSLKPHPQYRSDSKRPASGQPSPATWPGLPRPLLGVIGTAVNRGIVCILYTAVCCRGEEVKVDTEWVGGNRH